MEDKKKKLSTEAYNVTQKGATEAPFTGELLNNKEKGMYTCVVCNHELFSSDTKFESGTGWPSFYDPVNLENIVLNEDTSHGMKRIEVKCKNCDAHLGHVFEDGPTPTGKRYCINSCALEFKQDDKKKDENK